MAVSVAASRLQYRAQSAQLQLADWRAAVGLGHRRQHRSCNHRGGYFTTRRNASAGKHHQPRHHGDDQHRKRAQGGVCVDRRKMHREVAPVAQQQIHRVRRRQQHHLQRHHRFVIRTPGGELVARQHRRSDIYLFDYQRERLYNNQLHLSAVCRTGKDSVYGGCRHRKRHRVPRHAAVHARAYGYD